MVGATLATASGERAQPKKKKPSAAVDGIVRTIPAILAFDLSAIKESRAMKPQPTTNEVIS